MDLNSIAESFRHWAPASQAIATIVAIAVGALFAWRNNYLFRYSQPHLTVTHEITHRQVSPGYVQVAVTAILHNNSRVKVEILDGLFTIQQLAPVSDCTVENIYAETFIDKRYNVPPQWDTLNEVRLSWNKEALIAEPRELAAATFEYIVPIYVESILVTTYFYNSKVMGEIDEDINPIEADRRKRWWFWRRSGPRGWIRTSPHDIITKQHNVSTDTKGM